MRSLSILPFLTKVAQSTIEVLLARDTTIRLLPSDADVCSFV